MSKYIYVNGRVFDKFHLANWRSNGEPVYIFEDNRYGSCYEKPSDCFEFDNFEDLIEVGDLIKFYVENEKYERVEYYGTIDEFGLICRYSLGFNSKRFLEIWKRIDNTFVRICHKENGNWVID